MSRFKFISNDEENGRVIEINGNATASIKWLLNYFVYENKNEAYTPGRDSYRDMVEWLQTNHPEKCL